MVIVVAAVIVKQLLWSFGLSVNFVPRGPPPHTTQASMQETVARHEQVMQGELPVSSSLTVGSIQIRI